MRDLKHLIRMEDLLQQANNALIVQAKADGKVTKQESSVLARIIGEDDACKKMQFRFALMKRTIDFLNRLFCTFS